MTRRRQVLHAGRVGGSELRLADLYRARGVGVAVKLVNVSIPEETTRGINRVAAETGATKTDTVIALLNEGLAVWSERLQSGQPLPPIPRRRRRGWPPGASARTK